ncbi:MULTISPECIES: thioredoxin fold domain-containing protein [unclassified Saccharicrinis]|uniref:thioredoxin fold domain-containing protein n=1 Tax=unclassified Saccharicrinis TaxID=2646859 RepID=UPI003D351B0C
MRLLLILFLSFSFLNIVGIDNLRPSYQLIVFEGSDWCVNCIRIEKKVLGQPDFMEFLKHNNIQLIRVDFPQRIKMSKEQKRFNSDLAEKYNFDGTYPSIVISQTGSSEFKKITYKNQSIEEFCNNILTEIEFIK